MGSCPVRRRLRHTSRRARPTWNGTARVTPSAASSSSISTWRRIGAAHPPRPGRDAEDVVPEEGGEDVGEAPEVERRGSEASAPQSGMAEAVVELARFGLRQHFVGLDDLPEALVGVGSSETSGCSSRASPRKALLISCSLASRRRRDVVVVTLGRRHPRLRVARGLVVLVHGLDEARELVRRGADRADRLLVVHPQRADHADGAEGAVGEAVGGADESCVPQGRVDELAADADERTPRAERLADELEDRARRSSASSRRRPASSSLVRTSPRRVACPPTKRRCSCASSRSVNAGRISSRNSSSRAERPCSSKRRRSTALPIRSPASRSFRYSAAQEVRPGSRGSPNAKTRFVTPRST